MQKRLLEAQHRCSVSIIINCKLTSKIKWTKLTKSEEQLKINCWNGKIISNFFSAKLLFFPPFQYMKYWTINKITPVNNSMIRNLRNGFMQCHNYCEYSWTRNNQFISYRKVDCSSYITISITNASKFYILLSCHTELMKLISSYIELHETETICTEHYYHQISPLRTLISTELQDNLLDPVTET